MSSRNKKKMLFVLGMMGFFANGDNYAAVSLLSNIAQDLHISVNAAALSVTSYMLSFGLFTLVFGPLSDRFGKTNIINAAGMGTALFSILGATAFNLSSLMIFRAINGLFGAGIFPVTMALVGETFGAKERQKALGTIMGFMFLGAATATAIGGTIAYVSSWRMVYLLYGVGELVLALMMLKILQRDKPATNRLHIFSAYKSAVTNYRFMRLLVIWFSVGFSVFGSFTYAGVLLEESINLNILVIGLCLSLFGLGTVVGGRIGPSLRKRMNHGFLVFSAICGGCSLFVASIVSNVFIRCCCLFGFGMAFVFLQSTMIVVTQEKLAKMKGTAMSIGAFSLYLGGASGTAVNSVVMKIYGVERIFYNASFLFLGASLLAALLVSRYEIRKGNSVDSDDLPISVL